MEAKKLRTKKRIKKEKVLIIVRGGVVQNVFSSIANIQIDLLDYDNEVYHSEELALKDYNNRRANLNIVL